MSAKTCLACRSQFEILNRDREFYQHLSDVLADLTEPIPEPQLCPSCRLQRRMSRRNDYSYYARTCAKCGERIITVHSDDKPYPVYCNRCWWSDDWDAKAFGREIDFSVPFFAQFQALQAAVPRPAMANDSHVTSENIDYCQVLSYSKNCYLVTTSWRLEDCLYSTNCGEARDLIDCRFVGQGSELICEAASVRGSQSCTNVMYLENCSDCHFCVDLVGCHDCVGCIGLRHKQYHLLNQPYARDEYLRRLSELRLNTFSGRERFGNQFTDFSSALPGRAVFQANCFESTGHNLFHCKRCTAFNLVEGEDSHYYVIGTRPKNCFDILVGGEHELCYECVDSDHSYASLFGVWCWSAKHSFYNDTCHSVSNLFGCIGLRRSENCILNTPYREAEYRRLVRKLSSYMCETGEWGEFFTMSLSPFAYNESIAQDHFPLSPPKAAELGLAWKEASEKKPGSAYTLPDAVEDLTDDVLKQTLSCGECGRGYKIMPLELRTYRKLEIPPPRSCPNCRRKRRFAASGEYRLVSAICAECKAVVSAVAVGETRAVICEECFQRLRYN